MKYMHQGFTIWLTGLSGAGKSTLAEALYRRLTAGAENRVELLDGDVVRTHLSKGLGFSKSDRDINVRRIGFVCDLLARNGVIVLAAVISPYREVREEVRAMHGAGNFIEVHAKADLDTLAERDVKGLYKKALAGEIENFTGVSDPYEEPSAPEVIVRSDGSDTVEQGVAKVLYAASLLGYLEAPADVEPLLTPALKEDVAATLLAAGRLNKE